MIKRISCLVALMAAFAVHAAPFAVGCVSSTAADKYVVTGATHAPLNGEFSLVTDAVNCPAAGARAAKIDLSAVPEGNNVLNIALKSDLWGVLGAPVPFSFSRPSLASLVVDGIQLVK